MQMKLFPPPAYDEKDFISVCQQAMRLLAASDEPAPVELLKRGLRHSNTYIRLESIAALFRLNPQSAQPLLHSLLQDKEVRVQETAAWALACWEEPVPHQLLANPPYGSLREWIAKVFPSNWSRLFPLRSALQCAGEYPGSEALFQRLAEGISPQTLITFLLHENDYYSTEYFAAWNILKTQDIPPPLDLLPVLLSEQAHPSWEAALQIGKHQVASASDLLAEMWALTTRRTHAAITIALDDLGKIDATPTLYSELQGTVGEAEAAIWGLGILRQRGRAIPYIILHQMVDHPESIVRAQAIWTLSDLDEIRLEEALAAVNDSRLEPVVASCQAFLALSRAQIDIPTDLLVRQFIRLQDQKYQYNGGRYDGYTVRWAIRAFIRTLDELHADVPQDTLLKAFSTWDTAIESLIIQYWQRHSPDMIAQAEAFLQHSL